MDHLEVEPLDDAREDVGQLGDQLLGLSPEVALPPPVDGVEAGPEPEPQEPAHELVVLAPLHEGHEHAEEAILLVEVAALAREVLDHLEGLVEARDRGVLPLSLIHIYQLARA